MLELNADKSCWKNRSADSRHSNGYEFRPSSSRHLTVFIRSGIHTVFALNGKETFSTSVQSQRNIDDVLSINNSEFENYLGQMYPVELVIKGITENITFASYLKLLLSIGRDGPFTTNEMISISTSKTFRSWVVTFHLRRPMAFYFSSYTIRPGLLLVWMFYSEDQAAFQYATQSGIPRGTLGIIIQLVLWSIRGSYRAIWSIPHTNVKLHSDPWQVTVISQPIRLSINFMILIPSLTFTELRVVFMQHFQRVWHTSRELLPFKDTWFCPHFLDLLMHQLLRPEFAVAFRSKEEEGFFKEWTPWPVFALSWIRPGTDMAETPKCTVQWALHPYQVSKTSIKRRWSKGWLCVPIHIHASVHTPSFTLINI